MKDCTIDKNVELILDKTFAGERPLFKSSFISLKYCSFTEGESALKVSNNIEAENCDFSSKYVFWHDIDLVINNSRFYEGARASIWYSKEVFMSNCKVEAPKIFRDAQNIQIQNTTMNTDETLWDCKYVDIKNSDFTGNYLLLHSNNIEIENFTLDGNYSFQHTKDLKLKNVKIKSKDAFWNSENVTVYDSIIEGEYLGWYSKNLKFVNCKIIGTQALCYIENLTLENCEMIDTDLAFEYSSFHAEVINSIDSVKNPLSGFLKAKEIKKLILDDDKVDLDYLNIESKILEKTVEI